MKPVLTLVLIPKERRPGSIVQLLHSVVQIAGNIEEVCANEPTEACQGTNNKTG